MGHAVLLSPLISSPYERSFTTELSSRKAAYGVGILMIRRRVSTAAAGIMAPIGNHSFRATGITAYLANGGP
jgi:hypothetical protein